MTVTAVTENLGY